MRGWEGVLSLIRTPKMSKMDSDESADLNTVGQVLAEVLQVKPPHCLSHFIHDATCDLRRAEDGMAVYEKDPSLTVSFTHVCIDLDWFMD